MSRTGGLISKNYPIKECDVLIIGGGGAGIIAGVEASKSTDIKIIVVSKSPVSRSGLTPTANGGTNAAPPDEFFRKAIAAGNYLNDQNIVLYMANNIRSSLQKLGELGIPVTPLGEKSVCVPGTTALRKLREVAVKRPNVELLEDVLITGLIRDDGVIAGAYALDIATGEFFVIQASAVVVASGGLTGELYPHTSNNPFGITTNASGTGHIMSYLIGAELIDMEMIQFVPLPANPRCLYLRYFPDFWVGPYLNRNGEVVESNADSYLDGSYSYVFTQKLFREIQAGKGPIYVDRRGVAGPTGALPVADWTARRKLIKSLGIDPADNKINITLGSHFCMGGIRVNEKTETNIPGLFAAGEIMGGVHGAMRVSGYSFTQMIVFGFEAGKQAADYASKHRMDANHLNIGKLDPDAEKERIIGYLKPKPGAVSVNVLNDRLKQVMQDNVFIVRDATGLKQAITLIKEIKKDMALISVPGFRRFNLDWIKAIEFSLMVNAAELVTESALMREESRGCHYRSDFPQKDDKRWLKHTLVKMENGLNKFNSIPVNLSRLTPEAKND